MTLHSQIRATSSATGQILNTSEKHENHNNEESETYASCWTWPTGSCETAAELKPKKMGWPTQRPFLQQDNLGLLSIRVSVLFYTVSQFVGRSEPPLSQADYWEKNSHGLATLLRSRRTSNWRPLQSLRLHGGFEVHRCGFWLDGACWRLLEDC